MKFTTRILAAASLAVILVLAMGCGSSSKNPTGPGLGSESALDSLLNDRWVNPGGSQAFVGRAPDLHGAAAFAILAGATVTNTGLSVVTGNLGVGPGSSVTGFPPGILNGVLHVADPTTVQAMLDLTAAYNDLAGRTLAPVSVAGNLGGTTLRPGLYKSTSSLSISSGDLTLDGQGQSNGVFIFQIASALTTTAGRKVILIGGAKAANIFWQVGSSATIGTTSTFNGSILADQSITLNTGATLNGRALARIGGVTLDATSVVIPN